MIGLSTSQDMTRRLVDISRSIAASTDIHKATAFDQSILTDVDRFERWIPFEVLAKSEATTSNGGKLGIIEGIATTEAPDSDGDIILTDGIDWSYFIGGESGKGRGFIIDEHPVGNHNIVGHPLSISKVEVPYNDGMVKGTKVRAALYLEDKRGKEIFEKACVMRRAGGDRSYGFSIEGSVKPGGRKGRVVEKSTVKWLAITAAPKNELSWWDPIAKSLVKALGGGDGVETEYDRHVRLVLQTLATHSTVGLTAASGSEPDFEHVAERVTVNLCKANPQLSWGEATQALKRVLQGVTQSGL